MTTAKTANATTLTTPSDREIVISRLLDAPRELVWRAWTNPEHVTNWWGPNGFTSTTHEMKVAPGGLWRFILHGPDGTDYKNRILFHEVQKPERLVYDHSGEDETAHIQFHVTVTFVDEGGKTRVTLRHLYPTAEAREASAKFGAVEGGKQTLARLESYLAKM